MLFLSMSVLMLNFRVHHIAGSTSSSSKDELNFILKNQDETINVLLAQIELLTARVKTTSTSTFPASPPTSPNSELLPLKQKISSLQSQLAVAQSHRPNPKNPISSTKMASCDSLFGLGLINSYMTDPVEICNSGTSTITCYTHKQQHKAVEDTFCVGTNIVIDFSKVHGEHQATKPPRGVAQYHSFDSSSTTADCKNTANFPTTKFMPHHTLQMNSFKDQTPTSTDATRESTTTYLLARDEDFENAFHSSADFLNMELVYQGLNLNKDDTQVVLLDRNPDGPFFEMIQNAFTTPNKPLKRAANYNNKKIVFDKVVWHLESPAGIVFPKVGNNGATGCHNEYLYSKYRQRVLSAFDLWDVPPPTVPSLTLIVRKRTSR